MTGSRPVLRCAIYTRKSSEEGLDQAFNSLHAQREACEAYVKSQIGEGWKVSPTLYDDGGISGGTMERPSLKRLLADVDGGMVDVVVVYKVDRLTRSLADFAKIVERFDARQVSFVSVTQAFNTTNSMGRLTLNVLLSFAQFEREVTGERIRDKIAASKAKGMWMGGNLPLGYAAPTDPLTRALVVNPDEVDQVRHLFARYLQLQSVHALKAELDARGAVTAVKVSRTGTTRGGVPHSRGSLFALLRNRVYVGEIVHRGKGYPASHPPIVDKATFDAVQALLDQHTVARKNRPLKPESSPLMGRIVDADGIPMTPAIAYGKAGRKYRYYVSQPLQLGAGHALDRDVVRRVAAGAIEGLVMDRLAALGLAEPKAGWAPLRDRVLQVKLDTQSVVITLAKRELGDCAISQVRSRLPDGHRLISHSGKVLTLALIIDGRPVFRGGRTWIASPEGGSLASRTTCDPTLLKALRRAHRVTAEHGISPLLPVEANREARGIADSYHRLTAPLAFLAPDIQAAVSGGLQPSGLTAESMVDMTLPLAWDDQRKTLGFSSVRIP